MKLYTKDNKYYLEISGQTYVFELYETRQAFIYNYLYNKIPG